MGKNNGNTDKLYFLGLQSHCHEIKRLAPWRKAMTNLDSIVKGRDITLTKKGPSSQSYGFSSSHVWMWELDHKEGWMLKNRCFWAVVLEKTLESPLDCKEIKPVNPKRNQPIIYIGRSDAKAEAPILWPHDAKSQLIRTDPDNRKAWRKEENGTTEGEMVGWHHWLSGHGLGQPLETRRDRDTWPTAVHEVAKSRARLSD